MRMICNRKLIYSLTFFLLAFSGAVFAALQVDGTIQKKTVVPVNKAYPVFSFKLTEIAGVDTIRRIDFSTSAGFLFNQANRYESIALYTDSSNVFNEATSTKISETSLIGATETTVSLVNFGGLQIVTSNPTFFVVVKLYPDALANLSTLTLKEINYSNSVSGDQSLVLNEALKFTASGIKLDWKPASWDSATIKPNVVFPGQKNIGMAYFTLESKIENFNDISFSIRDKYAMFVSKNSSALDGITAFRVYTDDKLDDNEIDGESNEFLPDDEGRTREFTPKLDASMNQWSKSNLFFSLNDKNVENPTSGSMDNYRPILKDVKKEFWFAYDLGDNFPVDQFSKISLDLLSVTAKGSQSAVDITVATSSISSIDIPVGGMEVFDVKGIVETGATFGPESFAGILTFKVKAYQASSTLNSVEIKNDGTVPFNTGESSVNVVKIDIYQDSDHTGDWSELRDAKVGTLTLGGGKNQSSSATITMNVDLNIFDASKSYPENNSKQFFVVYHYGASLAPNTSFTNLTSLANLGKFKALGNQTELYSYTPDVISIIPTPQIALQESVIALNNVKSVVPNQVYQGEINVPMLYFEVNSPVQTDRGVVDIQNHQQNFILQASGITRVSLYRDMNQDKLFDLDSDSFVTTTAEFDNVVNGVLSISNVNFQKGVNRFFVTYDLGMKVSLSSFAAASQIKSLSIEGDTLSVGGAVPMPKDPAVLTHANVLEALISTIKVDKPSYTDLSVTQNLLFTIKNKGSKPISVTALSPKFYLNSLAGQDISYEFLAETIESFPIQLSENTAKEVAFNIKHSTAFSDGEVILDAAIMYDDQTNAQNNGVTQNIVFQRYYESAIWKHSLDTSGISFKVKSNMPLQTMLPAYLEHPIKVGGQEFLNGSQVDKNQEVEITFKTSAKDSLDKGTFSLIRGTDILMRQAQLDINQNYFTYSEDTGKVKFYTGEDVGDTTVLFSVRDIFGNSMPVTQFNYSISDSMTLNDPLFYPNPYVLGNNNLRLGFSVSEASTVSIYIVNMLGQVVFHKDEQVLNSGFNSLLISENESFLVPGIYLCKLISTSTLTGKTATKITKLAVH